VSAAGHVDPFRDDGFFTARAWLKHRLQLTGAATVPWNGDPLCRRHNILKERGFQVRRDESGHWHTYDPNGVEVA
jgi:hypothetical protein